MSFTILKIIKALISPSAVILIGMVGGIVALYKQRLRLGRFLLFTAIVLFYLLSTEPIAYLLSNSLEKQSLAHNTEQNELPSAIVILSGGAQEKEGLRPFAELSGASWRRLWKGLELYQSYNGLVPIIYSGGSGNPFRPISGEADLAKQYAGSFGVPEKQFYAESSSRDTYENAVAAKGIIDTFVPANKSDSRIALVTSARHMPRATKAMAKVGLVAFPYPADFSPGSVKLTPLSFLPSCDNFYYSSAALNEWFGLFVYSLRGRI